MLSNLSNFLKGWRTVTFNIFTAGAGVIGYLDQSSSQLAAIIPQKLAWILIAIGVTNILLRYATTTPIGSKT
jgi:hypothetical protein